jgi:hypothetical protein
MAEQRKTSVREIISAVIAGAMVLTAIIYWIVQIQSVLELIKLAGE